MPSSVFHRYTKSSISISLHVEGTVLYILVYTGSAVSIISEDTYQKNSDSSLRLQELAVNLFDFSQRNIGVTDCFVAVVGYKE